MKYKHIIFDFDGVLVESNEIRFNGFRKLFKSFSEDQVEQLVTYARANGGVSRYKKIKYFFNEIRREPVSEDAVDQLALEFSDLVEQDVVNAEPVKGALGFLEECSSEFSFAIVSGSDQKELRRIDHFFEKILGSPTEKKDNIAALLSELNWKETDTLYVGDSKNDLDAARANDLDFIGRSSGLVDWKSTDVRFVPDLCFLREMLVCP